MGEEQKNRNIILNCSQLETFKIVANFKVRQDQESPAAATPAVRIQCPILGTLGCAYNQYTKLLIGTVQLLSFNTHLTMNVISLVYTLIENTY